MIDVRVGFLAVAAGLFIVLPDAAAADSESTEHGHPLLSAEIKILGDKLDGMDKRLDGVDKKLDILIAQNAEVSKAAGKIEQFISDRQAEAAESQATLTGWGVFLSVAALLGVGSFLGRKWDYVAARFKAWRERE